MTRNSIFLPSLATAATFAVAAALALAAPVAATGLAATAPMSAEAARLDGLVDRAWAAPDTSSPHRLAQYSPVPPRGRPVSDHDHARQTARAGENRGFDELMRSAQSRGRGEYLGVEPDIGRNVYRFKFLRSGGNVVWVDVDGRTGRVIAERD